MCDLCQSVCFSSKSNDFARRWVAFYMWPKCLGLCRTWIMHAKERRKMKERGKGRGRGGGGGGGRLEEEPQEHEEPCLPSACFLLLVFAALDAAGLLTHTQQPTLKIHVVLVAIVARRRNQTITIQKPKWPIQQPKLKRFRNQSVAISKPK